MVSKELFLVLIVFFSFLFFNLIIEKSSACVLSDTFYAIVYSERNAYLDSSCKHYIYVKDFYPSLSGGCVMGYYAGHHYKAVARGGEIDCEGPEAKWFDVPIYDGQICKRRDGWNCTVRVKEGVYDRSEGICVVCDGRIQKEAFDCTGDYTGNSHPGNGKCESACGASRECDERDPRSFISIDKYCNSTCDYNECNEKNLCKVTDNYICTYYYGTRYIGWQWVRTDVPSLDFLEDGRPPEECFDGIDNDCNKVKDCYDPKCAGARNPTNEWDICCQKDDDCPPKDGVKGKCRSPPPSGSGGTDPTTGDYTYRCTWGKCGSNLECAEGYCCTDDPSGPGTGEGICVPAGRTVPGKDGKSYICVRVESTTQASVFTNLFNLIFNKKQEGTYTIWMEEEEFLRMKSQRTTTFFDRIKNIFDILNQFLFQRLIP
ncbi:MAG: hypothetical protein QXO07_01735 [Candidatus Aenigmatarchaeota archaeon]